MLLWEQPPSNERHPRKKANAFYATSYTSSEFGVDVLTERMCEPVIQRATGIINPTFEAIEATWICIDQRRPGFQRQVVYPNYRVDFVTVYPTKLAPKGRQNDLFSFTLSFRKPDENPFYSHDRSVMTHRLLPKICKSWIEAWDLMEKVEGHSRPKWPVKLWVHGDPHTIWELSSDGQPVQIMNHAAVDETIIDQCFFD